MPVLKINGYPITAPFNSIDSVHLTPHKGIDLAMSAGDQVRSVGDGVVMLVQDEGAKSFGKYVKIHMYDGADAIYAHLSNFKVTAGEIVHKGDVIGLAGTSGDSTGPHLHLQLMQNGVAIDPSKYVFKEIPWYDLEGHMTRAWDSFQWQLSAQATDIAQSFWHWLGDFIGIALPTLAAVGILWWMVPFLPKSDTWAPKIVGSSLLLFMFYTLIRGSY